MSLTSRALIVPIGLALLGSGVACRAVPRAAYDSPEVPRATPRVQPAGPVELAAPGDRLAELPPPSREAAAVRPHELERYHNLDRRAGLSVGGAFLGNFDTTLRVNADPLVGAVLDLEDFLGVEDDNSVVRVDGFWRIAQRHRVDASLFDINRSGSRTVADDLPVGGVILPAGEIETGFDTLVAKLAYRYDFVSDYRTTIGASLGLHTMRLDASFKSTIGSVEEEFKTTAPLPVLGMHAEYGLSEKWRLLGSLEFLQVEFGGSSGFLSDTKLVIEHDTWEHFGWGVGFNGFNLDIDLEASGPLSAEVEYAYQGALLYMRFLI